MAADPCPCGLGSTYAQCCGRFHSGLAHATTAVELMRSRYSAFVRHDAAYLERTWHPDTRPQNVQFRAGQRWVGLEIKSTERGGRLDIIGVVEFIASYVIDGKAGDLYEASQFVRQNDEWMYVD